MSTIQQAAVLGRFLQPYVALYATSHLQILCGQISYCIWPQLDGLGIMLSRHQSVVPVSVLTQRQRSAISLNNCTTVMLTAQFGRRATKVGVSPRYKPRTPSCLAIVDRPPVNHVLAVALHTQGATKLMAKDACLSAVCRMLKNAP